MLLNNRHGAVDSDAYRYGFNGKEKDDEVKGGGAQYDYGFRIYDSRLGKFLSQDPLFRGYPFYTPYQFAGNRPIQAMDLDGLEEYFYWIPLTQKIGTVKLELVSHAERAPDLTEYGLYKSAEEIHKINAEMAKQNELAVQRAKYEASQQARLDYEMSKNPLWAMYQLSMLSDVIPTYRSLEKGDYAMAGVGLVAGMLEVKGFTKGLRKVMAVRILNDVPLNNINQIIARIDKMVHQRAQRLAEMARWLDPQDQTMRSGYRAHELSTAVDFELTSGIRLSAQNFGCKGDFVDSLGTSYDAVGTTLKGAEQPTFFADFTQSISKHVDRMINGDFDKIILDFNNLNQSQIDAVKSYIKSNHNTQTNNIIMLNDL
ncbi:RHS repeat-associated core domain-containing protein [Nonlabens ulvanivorans]|uniref:RHS repeat-associated protein n=1 Tax=Nonlabens ulvanivorans TaxID=906888 RepID=A0A084JZB4_NONUL|nr:RHS repeat-associated core domain-containing protein [Nonlabens ulvanivorans]KEZ94298.1 hypothetical protein IL45_02285 [Nonlabens ulvanivorans]PRX08669.1 RHS repeat-associated protein [Nonlabens ulvanivorans]